MSEEMTQGLEDAAVATVEEKTTRRRKEQTPEDVETINAGVAKLRELGVSDKTLVILENLAPVWNGSDKEAIALAKATVIEHFGGSDALKDFVDGDFQAELQAFNGIAKLMPISNNIKSFYARRPTSKKVATIQVNIGGVLYSVDKAFYESLADMDKAEKKEAIMNHESFKKVGDIPEIL